MLGAHDWTFLEEVMSVISGFIVCSLLQNCCSLAPKLLQRHQSYDRTDNLTFLSAQSTLYSFI